MRSAKRHVVVDNAVSHAAEMQPFKSLIEQDEGIRRSLTRLGNGEYLACKLAG